MNVATLLRGLLAATVVAVLALCGCASDPRRCCDSFGATEDAGVYCNAHREAVMRFVRAGKDRGERQGRLDWFKGVFKTLEPLKDSDAIHDRLAPFETTHPEFWQHYDRQHFWAGRDTNLGLERRGELMICGFRHGLFVLEQELADAR